MTRNANYLAVLGATAMVVSGCHTTKVYTPGATSSTPWHDQRQWFTVAGLVPLSDPAGQECRNGIHSSESEMSDVDILINVGLSLAGAYFAPAVCDASNASYTACTSSIATLVPFLVSSRTVRYTCVDSPSAWLPGDALGLGAEAYGLTSITTDLPSHNQANPPQYPHQ